jgi:hypothetical protein
MQFRLAGLRSPLTMYKVAFRRSRLGFGELLRARETRRGLFTMLTTRPAGTPLLHAPYGHGLFGWWDEWGKAGGDEVSN